MKILKSIHLISRSYPYLPSNADNKCQSRLIGNIVISMISCLAWQTNSFSLLLAIRTNVWFRPLENQSSLFSVLLSMINTILDLYSSMSINKKTFFATMACFSSFARLSARTFRRFNNVSGTSGTFLQKTHFRRASNLAYSDGIIYHSKIKSKITYFGLVAGIFNFFFKHLLIISSLGKLF